MHFACGTQRLSAVIRGAVDQNAILAAIRDEVYAVEAPRPGDHRLVPIAGKKQRRAGLPRVPPRTERAFVETKGR